MSPTVNLAARELIQLLAREARPAGSAAEDNARGACASLLRARGFEVVHESFSYSAFVARWGVPMFGFYLAACAASVVLISRSGRAGELPTFVLRFLAFMCVFAPLIGMFAERSRAMPAVGVNLVATRGSHAPSIWLAAHLDSKSQPVPMLVRIGALIVALLSSIALAVTALVALRYYPAPRVWMLAAAALFLAALPLAACTVGSRSPGALDNASGVAAVLRAVELEPATIVGVVLTSAEELGLQGARAWAASHKPSHPTQCVINCDTLDDNGRMRCMIHKNRDGVLARRLQTAAAETGEQLVIARTPPGVLLDSMAFRRGGWSTATLARATFATLARVHTPRDTAARVDGDGAERVARILAAFLRQAV